MTLRDLAPGDVGIVRCIHSGRLPPERLMALGLIPGARVRRMYSAPFGDPTAYRIQGYVLALGAQEAAQVELRAPRRAALPRP